MATGGCYGDRERCSELEPVGTLRKAVIECGRVPTRKKRKRRTQVKETDRSAIAEALVKQTKTSQKDFCQVSFVMERVTWSHGEESVSHCAWSVTREAMERAPRLILRL